MRSRSRPWLLGIRLFLAAACLVGPAVLGVVSTEGTARAQALLDPTTLTKYVDAVPNPLGNIVTPVGTSDGLDLYEVEMTQFDQKLHDELPPTTVWGYNGAYPGPTFDVQRGEAIKVNWVNNLVDGGGAALPHLLPVDTTVHGAGTEFPEVRTVAHLHGGVVEPQSDGFPEHWFTADPNALENGMGGPAGNSALYTYHNDQPASTLWYHDHGMGITRLNVYAGLAGFYLVRDDQEAALNLPSGEYEVPLVIQDRSFYEDGQLFYPRGPGDLTNPGGADPLSGLPPEFDSDASVVPHYYGNTNLVNGAVWPVMDVEPRKYRLRFLNGSNSRFYDLQLDTGADPLPFHQIGSDGGLLEAPTIRDQMLMAPAERADVIVDFSSLGPDDEVILRNLGPDGPFEYPGATYTPADPNTTGQVMKFHVVESTGTDTSSLPSSLVSVPRIPESEAVATRQLSLVEDVDEFGRPKLLLNGAKWTDPTTELPLKGTTEIWEITNSTTDSHPIHLHLVQFQVLDRVSRQLGEIPLEDHELGWKDTVKVNRRETVRVIARFQDFEGLYVWHCHILEHEDHEMMRRYEVVPGPELIVEQGVTLALDDPHTTPAGYILTVDGILSTPQLEIDGLLRGSGEVQSNVISRGDVSPGGEGGGALTVTGDMTLLDSSDLAIELGGSTSGQFDRLLTSGDANLGGALSVRLVDDFTPVAGDAFEILSAGGVLGETFDDENLPDGYVWDVDYGVTTPNAVTLKDLALLGDMNNDGVVTPDDVNPFVQALTHRAQYELQSYGADADLAGDVNGDGEFNLGDVGVFKALVASSAPDAAQSVPEPASALLMLFALVAVGMRRRRSVHPVSEAASP